MGTYEEIQEAAANFVCNFYFANPASVLAQNLVDAAKLAYDELCRPPQPPGLPPAPTLPFTGGRCCATYYQVYYDLKPQRNGAWNIDAYQQQVRGVVSNMQTRQTGANQIQYFHTVTSCTGIVQDVPITFGNYQGDGQARINRVIALYGGANNCGNPPEAYPITPPIPPAGVTSPPVAINLNDGTDFIVNFNLKPPVPLPVPVVGIPPVIVNLIKPELNINIPIEFNFDGTVNFGGGEGGGDGFGQPDRDKLDDIADGLDNLRPPIDDIDDQVRDLKDNYEKDRNRDKNKPIDPADYAPSPPPKAPGKHEAAYLAAVEITLTQIPQNAKKQYGDGAPDLVYAGWFEFQRLGKSLPRNYIHFQQSVFLAPEGVDGYAFTLYNGFEGLAKEIINKPEE